MTFFTKQKDGDAPGALQDLRGMEGIDLPYMRETRAGQTSLKKGDFRATEIESNDPAFYILGDVVKGGALLNAKAYGGISYNQSMRLLANIDISVDPGPNNETYNYRQMVPIGRGSYVHYTRYQGIQFFRFDPATPSNVSLRLKDIYLRVSMGKRKTVTFNVSFSSGYYNYYDYQHVSIPSQIDGIGDDYSPVTYVQPLDAAAKPPSVLVSFPQNIGSVDIRGVAHHDLLYTTIDKNTGPTAPPVLRAIPRDFTALTDKVAMTNYINVITPMRWVTLIAFSWENASPYGYLGGKIGFFKTEDGGLSWSDLQSNDPAFAVSTAGFPLPSDYVALTGVILLNRVLGFAMGNMEPFTVCSPTTYMVSYPYWGPAPALGVPNNGYGTGSGVPNYVGQGFLCKMIRTTDNGASWAQVAMPALLETVTSWERYTHQMYVWHRTTYLGAGFMITQIRAGLGDNFAVPVNPVDEKLVWNLAVSSDYGATWTCIPKVGLPDIAKSQPRYVGSFKVLKKKTQTSPGTYAAGLVVLSVWGGDGYYLYSSVDDGASWKKSCLIAKSEAFRQMDYCSAQEGATPENGFNFNDIFYTGPAQSPVPVAIETPWRYDSSKKWVAE